MSRLNELKNSEQYRAKTKQLLSEYHSCIEENLRLKEMNLKLQHAKKSAEVKLDVTSKKLQQLLENNTPQKLAGLTSGKASFAPSQGDGSKMNPKLLAMTNNSSHRHILSMSQIANE